MNGILEDYIQLLLRHCPAKKAPLRNVTCLFLASKTGTQESTEKH